MTQPRRELQAKIHDDGVLDSYDYQVSGITRSFVNDKRTLASRSKRAMRWASRAIPPRKNFERHITAQCRVARTVHLTHAPCIQRRDDFLSPESRPLLKRHNFQALYTSAKAAEGTLCLGYELWMGGKCQSGTRIEHGSYWPFRAVPA